MFTPAEILGPSGRIAARLTNYEARAEQLQMAEAVDRAIREKHHLVVEAGTGVGKSFAYLVPAILAAAGEQRKAPSDDEDESGDRSAEDSHNRPHPSPLPEGEGTLNKLFQRERGRIRRNPVRLHGNRIRRGWLWPRILSVCKSS